MPHRPQHALAVRPRHALAVRQPPALAWDAAAGAAALLCATLVALSMPTADLTLHTVHDAPSRLPATSQPPGPHWTDGGQEP